MKPKSSNALCQSTRAFSRVEVLCIIVVLVAAAALTLPYLARPHARPSRLNCVNNLKQIGLAFRSFGLDNEGHFPMNESVTNGGASELAEAGSVFPIFQVMSNELSTPIILVCPNDAFRARATAFTNLTDKNISYFVNLDTVETNAMSLLGGDRNLTNQPPAHGRFVNITRSTALSWTKAQHSERGNLLFADGSVNGYANGNVPITKSMPEGVTNRLAVP